MPNGESSYPAIDDKALIAMSVQKDMHAFEELVIRHEKRIVAAACRLCGDRQEGEDLAQEVFVKAWRALPGYRGQASFTTWMMAILCNLWKDRLRRSRAPEESLDEEIEGEDGRMPRQRQDGRPGPEQLAAAGEVHEILGGMIRKLPPEFREALILRDVQGFSYEEVAAITGSALGTVKSRINRGRAQMKASILHYQELNPGFFRLNQTGKDKTGPAAAEGGEPHEG